MPAKSPRPSKPAKPSAKATVEAVPGTEGWRLPLPLARDPTTEQRALDLALHHPSSTLRGRVAFYSLLKQGSPQAVQGLTAALEAPGEFANPDGRMAATIAVLRTANDPAAAFDRLAPFLTRSFGGTEADVAAAIAVAVGLQSLPPGADPRWRAVFARLLSHPTPQLQHHALECLSCSPSASPGQRLRRRSSSLKKRSQRSPSPASARNSSRC